MPTFLVMTLGCKVNQYESEQLTAQFLQAGFTPADNWRSADCAVVNSCSVTATAARKGRNLLNTASPSSLHVLTGCYAQMLLDTEQAVANVDLLVPNTHKDSLVAQVLARRPDWQGLTPVQPPVRRRRTRAFLKVQDGCSNRCAYCSIPLTRPAMYAKPLPDILEETAGLAAQGVQEVVLTGILLGAWTDAQGHNLSDLVEALASSELVPRIRLSSVELTDITEPLITLAAQHPRVCPHLHIPLQSGDAGVLARMGRPYTPEDVLRMADSIYKASDEIAITTDIIVGFPGEDESAFLHTVNLVRAVQYARCHVFPFSPRPMTLAQTMRPQVPERVRSERSAILIHTATEVGMQYAARHIGRITPVLLERRTASGNGRGYSANYLDVTIDTTHAPVGAIIPVRLLDVTETGVRGEQAGRPLFCTAAG